MKQIYYERYVEYINGQEAYTICGQCCYGEAKEGTRTLIDTDNFDEAYNYELAGVSSYKELTLFRKRKIMRPRAWIGGEIISAKDFRHYTIIKTTIINNSNITFDCLMRELSHEQFVEYLKDNFEKPLDIIAKL